MRAKWRKKRMRRFVLIDNITAGWHSHTEDLLLLCWILFWISQIKEKSDLFQSKNFYNEVKDSRKKCPCFI